MTQSRTASLVETIIGIVIGFVISMLMTAIVLPAYGHPVTWGDNLQITGLFTLTSIARGYLVRRWFNRMQGAAQ